MRGRERGKWEWKIRKTLMPLSCSYAYIPSNIKTIGLLSAAYNVWNRHDKLLRPKWRAHTNSVKDKTFEQHYECLPYKLPVRPTTICEQLSRWGQAKFIAKVNCTSNICKKTCIGLLLAQVLYGTLATLQVEAWKLQVKSKRGIVSWIMNATVLWRHLTTILFVVIGY